MKKIDTLKIQKNIEEKRLIFGIELEKILLKKITFFLDFVRKIFAAKSCAFFGCFTIIALSILVRSTRDIGHDSGACLEIASKMLKGGEYYKDFWENNLPLFFLFNTIPHFLAQISQHFFPVSPIIFLEILTNLVGIFSLFFSAKILSRADLSRDRTIFNLIILSFACGFFLRVLTLQFNEFGTKSTYFLAFAFPYISYHFLNESQLKKPDQIIIGGLAALLFCLKPHYGILVITFEVWKFFQKKSLAKAIESAFCLRNYTTLLLLIFYFLFLLKWFPDYISAIPHFSQLYYNSGFFSKLISFYLLKEDLFPIFFLTFLCFFLIKQNRFLQPLFLASCAAGLIISFEMIGGEDQRFAFYSLSLPFIVTALFVCLRNGFINFKRDWLVISLLLFLPQFDHGFFTIARDLCVFWWVFVLVITWKTIGTPSSSSALLITCTKQELGVPIKNQEFSKIFLPQDVQSWLYFLSFATLTILSSFTLSSELSWIISAIIFVALVNFYQKLHEKFTLKKEFSRLSAAVIFTIISYLINLHLTAIFNIPNNIASHYKSPNYTNDQLIKTVKNHLKTDEEFTTISVQITGAYPAINYLKKENPLPFLYTTPLYAKIVGPTGSKEAEEYFLSRLKRQLASEKNKLVFIEKTGVALDENCRISFLEFYLRDPEFRKIFLKNYVFLNRIIERKSSGKKVEFFADEEGLKLEKTENLTEHDIEVYRRK